MPPTPDMERPVVVIDDEDQILLAVETTLQMAGLKRVVTCSDSRSAMDILDRHDPGAVLLDLNMPHIDGNTLMPMIMARYPDVPVIIITGTLDVDTAVNAIKSGAHDYIVKPVDEGRLIAAVLQALRFSELKQENRDLRSHLHDGGLQHPDAFSAIISQSPKMMALFQYIESIATTAAPVLIRGETGVGKELVARAIHRLSGRSGDFMAINVAGLDDNMFSDTLFGHVRGAFTGADAHREGLIEKASGGTLFLDEIGDLNQGAQVKLLRLLQENEYLPLGQDASRASDARVIASTHADLWAMQERNQFRTDLHYRLRTHRIWIPPLRDRNEDLPLLCDHFLRQAADSLGKPLPEHSPDLIPLLETYPFPGNIRELKAMVFDALAQHRDGPLTADVFKDHMAWALERHREISAPAHSENAAVAFGPTLPTIHEATRQLVTEAMRRSRDNQTRAAALLGITQQALSKRLKKIRLDDT